MGFRFPAHFMVGGEDLSGIGSSGLSLKAALAPASDCVALRARWAGLGRRGSVCLSRAQSGQGERERGGARRRWSQWRSPFPWPASWSVRLGPGAPRAVLDRQEAFGAACALQGMKFVGDGWTGISGGLTTLCVGWAVTVPCCNCAGTFPVSRSRTLYGMSGKWVQGNVSARCSGNRRARLD